MSTFLGITGILLTLYFAFIYESQATKDANELLCKKLDEDLDLIMEECVEEEYQQFRKNMDRYYEEKK